VKKLVLPDHIHSFARVTDSNKKNIVNMYLAKYLHGFFKFHVCFR